jgi:hypothetical protein
MRGFMFPATAAILLRERTWMPDVAIASWLRNYGKSGERFFIQTTRPGNDHYLVQPAPGGFCIVPCRMAPGTPAGYVLA